MTQNAPADTNPGNYDVFNIAWPLAVKATMLHGIIVIDAYLVSSLGESSLASLGLAGAIAGLLLGFFFAFSGAAQIRTAQAFGTSNPRLLKSVFLCGLSINLSIALVGMCLIWAFAEGVLTTIAPTPQIAADALAYLAAFTVVFLAEAVSQNTGSFFNGCGRTRIPLYSYALSLPVNVSVSYALIHGMFGLPELGLIGAAIGSSLAALLRVVFLGVVLLKSEMHMLRAAGWESGSLRTAMRRHLAFSFPIAVTFLSMSVATQVSMLIFAQMDIIAFAALTIILPWVQVTGTMGMSWAQATGILIAQLLGSQAHGEMLDRFLATAWRGVFVAAALVSILLASVSLFASHIYAQLQPETVATLQGFLPVLLVLPVLRCTNAVCGNTLRAAGDTVYVMKLFVGAQWLFRIPMMAAFVLWFDLPAVWVLFVLLLEELVKLPWFHLRVFTGRWKTAQVFQE